MRARALAAVFALLALSACSGDDTAAPGLGGGAGARATAGSGGAGATTSVGGSAAGGSAEAAAGSGGVAGSGGAPDASSGDGAADPADAMGDDGVADAADPMDNHVEAAEPCPDAGKALQFTGDKRTRVTAAIDALPLGNASRTVEMWVYTVHDTWRAEHHMFQYGSSNPRDACLGVDFGDGPYPQMQTYTNGAGDMFFNVPTTTVMETGWMHLAVVYDGPTKTISGVVNGNTIRSTTLPAEIKTTSSVFSLGFSPTFSGNSGFTGKIDELRIWSAARSDADIKAAMNQRLKGTEAGLVAYFHFDEGSGTTAKDVVKGYSATLTAGSTPTEWVDSGVTLRCP